MSHKTEIEAVCKLVRLGGGKAWKLHQVGRLRGSKGLPDVFCVWKGEAFWVEVKVRRDKLLRSRRRSSRRSARP